MSDPCPSCGKDRNLVGYRHNCVMGVTPAVTVTPPVTKPVTKPVTVTKSVTCARCAELEAVIRDLRQALARPVPMSGAERVRKHRALRRKVST